MVEPRCLTRSSLLCGSRAPRLRFSFHTSGIGPGARMWTTARKRFGARGLEGLGLLFQGVGKPWAFGILMASESGFVMPGLKAHSGTLLGRDLCLWEGKAHVKSTCRVKSLPRSVGCRPVLEDLGVLAREAALETLFLKLVSHDGFCVTGL